MNSINFARSFLHFVTDRPHHTAVARMAATCQLTLADGTSKWFVLTDECICETMYAQEELVQPPGQEFLLIAAPGDQFMFIKNASGSGPDQREAHRVGADMTTYAGRSTVKSVEVAMSHYPSVQKLTSDEQICEAILSHRSINGQTHYTDPADGTKVQMEYPVRCLNCAQDELRWQMDTGRVLALARGPVNGLLVERLAPSYIVFNQSDWAELAILKTTLEGATASQYSDIRKLRVCNELFVV